MSAIAALVLTLIGTTGAGALLRRSGRLSKEAAPALNRVVVDVTLPALVVAVLCDAELDLRIGLALVATAAGQAVGLAGGVAVARLQGLPRAARGSAGLCAGFANTGFLGVPVAIALFGARGLGASTAILVDSFNTTVLLWTSGLLFAQRMGGAARASSPWRALATPLSAAVVLGLALNLGHVALPEALRGALEKIGSATTALVFLSLGLSLDLAALRGRGRALAGVSVAKLVLAPLAALLAARALRLEGDIARVAVMQAGMPTALLAAILAAEAGCDAAFAAGITVTTTILATISLPALLWWLSVA